MGDLHQALHHPETEIIDAPERIDAGLGAANDQPFERDDQCLHAEIDHDIDREQHHHFDKPAGAGGEQPDGGQEQAEPLDGHEAEDEGQGNSLRQSAPEAAHQWRRGEGKVLRQGRAEIIQTCRHGPQRAVGIDIVQGDHGEALVLPDGPDKTCGKQRVPAQFGEEIGLQRNGLTGENRLGDLQKGGLGVGFRLVLLAGHVNGGEFHGLKGLAVHLAGRQFRQGGDAFKRAGTI